MKKSKNQFRVEWAESAIAELRAIVDYIAVENKSAAKKLLSEIKKLAAALDLYPERGRFVPELYDYSIATYRELIHRQWRLIYKVEAQAVCIITVLDSRRDLKDLLLERCLLAVPAALEQKRLEKTA